MDIMEKLLVRYNAAFDCHCVINLSELPGNLPFIELNRIIFSLYAGEEVQVYWPLHSVFLSGPLRLCDHHGHCHIALPDVDSTRRVILILQRIMIGSTPCRARVALTPLRNFNPKSSFQTGDNPDRHTQIAWVRIREDRDRIHAYNVYPCTRSDSMFLMAQRQLSYRSDIIRISLSTPAHVEVRLGIDKRTIPTRYSIYRRKSVPATFLLEPPTPLGEPQIEIQFRFPVFSNFSDIFRYSGEDSNQGPSRILASARPSGSTIAVLETQESESQDLHDPITQRPRRRTQSMYNLSTRTDEVIWGSHEVLS
ncbi:hypothetical protein F4825DRAFT_436229 [Nemania diffusa]|nr:hypothetical protein F4825DRAFT_436229 [Nemania diffusa]